MKREIISQGISDISTRYIQEAADYIPEEKQINKFRGSFVKKMIAAIVILCVFVFGTIILSSSQDTTITAYAYGTDEEITADGTIIKVEEISDAGEMGEKALGFYFTGKAIETMRFLNEFDSAQNSMVSYLSYDGDGGGVMHLTIGRSPDKRKEDIIVTEVTFENGKTVTKAMTITQQDDGTCLVSFDDYKIEDSDAFVECSDGEAISMDESDEE